MTSLDLLGAQTVELLHVIGSVSETFGVRAFLVGGAVRDLELGERTTDVDVMLTGDAIKFAHRLVDSPELFSSSGARPKKVTPFKHYGTAKLLFAGSADGGDFAIDFATARKESYPVPGGRPEIEKGTLETDLARRDFSVNALALELSSSHFGDRVDLFGGVDDLSQRWLRVLHDRSFIDDPARLIRGVRLGTRLGFSFEPKTQSLFNESVSAKRLLSLPAGRLRDEYRKALAENDPERVRAALDEVGLLSQIPDAH